MITYKPLLKILIDKNMKKHDLIKVAGLSRGTIAKLSKGEYTSLEVIDRLCAALDCQPADLIEYIPSTQAEE